MFGKNTRFGGNIQYRMCEYTFNIKNLSNFVQVTNFTHFLLTCNFFSKFPDSVSTKV